MTTSAQPVQEKKSRLDPEQIARRDFLGLAAMGTAALSLLFAFVGALRLPRAAVLPSPSKKFKVALPESLAMNRPFVPPGRSVAVYKSEKGVYALSIVCTHLGCIVKESPEGFDCPCHGSKFSADGSVLRGPAPKALPLLAVKHVGGNEYLVDEGTLLDPTSAEAYA